MFMVSGRMVGMKRPGRWWRRWAFPRGLVVFSVFIVGFQACMTAGRSASDRETQEAEARGAERRLDASTPLPHPPMPDALDAARSFLGTRPLYEQPLAVGMTIPSGLNALDAKSCGTCHAEIYAEWSVSTHALAWRDPQFQAEITKSGNRWLCLNCHTPLMVQHDTWPVGLNEGDIDRPRLIANPLFDASLREEGITCAGCHVREGVIHGPGLEQSTAPHPVVKDPAFRSEALCLRCHQAEATYPGKSYACTFATGKEWRSGPYAAKGQTCAFCHMPSVRRSVAPGAPVRSTRRHWWRGAGIPKIEGIQPPLEANPPGLGVEASWRGEALVVDLVNARAGHKLPTGDPERWIQVDVQFLTGTGQAIGDKRSIRIGQKWEWYPVAKKLSDNRLAPLEHRERVFIAPPGARKALVVASSHRMSPETADYHHLKDYPIGIETHRFEVPRQ